MIPKFIVMTTAFGNRDISELHKEIPNLVECKDYNHDAMGNFLNSMRYTEEAAIHLEDDIVLCDNFYEKIIAAVNEHPDELMTFFTLRSEIRTKTEPYYVPGSKFSMNQCFYIPAGMGPEIADYYERWARKEEHPTGYDIMMADWMKEKKMKFIQWVPNLVNHQECKSLINSRRSSKRVDKFFKK